MPAQSGGPKTRAQTVEIVSRLEVRYGAKEWAPRYDPMEELVSCILSQHTTDATSFPTFDRLRELHPTWQEIVDLGQERLVEHIKRAGLANQKAKSILACLQEIRNRNGDYTLEPLRTMPPLQARDWLLSLPGVGPKTASIVLCFALGMPIVPVDTHVYRVSWRLGLIPEDVGEGKAHDLLLKVVPGEMAFRFHVALIEHGRAVCKAPLPKCEDCVVMDLCRWKRKGGPEKKRKQMTAGRKQSNKKVAA